MGGISLGGNFHGGEFSWMGLFLGEGTLPGRRLFLGVLFLGGTFPVGTFPGGDFSAGATFPWGKFCHFLGGSFPGGEFVWRGTFPHTTLNI